MTRSIPVMAAIALCIALWGCENNRSGEFSPEELDSLVEEIWLDLNEGRLVPLRQWLAQSSANEVHALSRAEADRMAEVSQRDHGVELHAIVDDQMSDWTQLVVGRIERLQDREAYSQSIEAIAPGRISVEYGNRWVVISEPD